VKAMAGRPEIKLGNFDPAIDANRQTGSSFKAFTLTAAYNQDISPNSYWNGPPQITIPNKECYTTDPTTGKYGPWSPSNYADESAGTMNLLNATANSVNTIFAQLVVALKNGPQDVVSTAHDLGIRSHLQPVCSITPRTQDVTPLELTGAYATRPAHLIR